MCRICDGLQDKPCLPTKKLIRIINVGYASNAKLTETEVIGLN